MAARLHRRPIRRSDRANRSGGGPNGLARGANGTLYVAQNGGVFGASGPAEPGVQVIVGGRVEYLVTGLGAPNDLMFGPDGRLWVTDTRCEIDPMKPGDGLPGQVWAVDVSTGDTELMVASGPGTGQRTGLHSRWTHAACHRHPRSRVAGLSAGTCRCRLMAATATGARLRQRLARWNGDQCREARPWWR